MERGLVSSNSDIVENAPFLVWSNYPKDKAFKIKMISVNKFNKLMLIWREDQCLRNFESQDKTLNCVCIYVSGRIVYCSLPSHETRVWINAISFKSRKNSNLTMVDLSGSWQLREAIPACGIFGRCQKTISCVDLVLLRENWPEVVSDSASAKSQVIVTESSCVLALFILPAILYVCMHVLV